MPYKANEPRRHTASTTLSLSKLNTLLVVLLCTLRGRRRNTRYRGPYPNWTFTGCITPASGASPRL
jgi:hypothetical protein